MKLKARINGVDYDIVQGAAFTDNFNETLDSATVCLDQVRKIDGVRQYDDVFIWNADESFDGYGGPRDIAELDGDVTIGGDKHTTGTWTDIYISSGGLTIEDKGAYFELSGQICQIWSCIFYGFTDHNEGECRYRGVRMDITAGFVTNEGTSQTEHTEDGFRIEAADGRAHGGIDSEIILTNGTHSFACSYSPDTQSFTVDKWQGATLIKWLQGSAVGYQVDSMNKTFDIQVHADDFSGDGIVDFSIEIVYRGRTYVFTMTGIEDVDEWTKVVTFANPDLSSLGITFVGDQNGEWNSEGLENRETTATDPSGILRATDGMSISNLMGVRDGTKKLPTFYKHLLFDKFPEEQVGLETGLYKCAIDLFSETKRLEKIPLPNISITQSLVQEKKRSCWFYMKEYVEAFSPKYKKVSNRNGHKWRYVSKYYLSESGTDRDGLIANLKDIFDNVICPEMSMTNPSLKDLLAQIMKVKDMIPVVKDDVIYGLDISHTVGDFSRKNVNFVKGSLSSDDFATDARREHSNALSQENSAHMVEYLGFRSPNSVFLTLDQLTLETRFPIYKINSIKMCYYKEAELVPAVGSSLPRVKKYFLCKQDITPLILQNTVRNTLSTNWHSFLSGRTVDNPHDFSNMDYEDFDGNKVTMDFAKQFKICTIGYDIGSNKLMGWGAKYQYLNVLWFKAECSYIENIVNLVDAINPYGLTNPLQLKGGEGYEGVTVPGGIMHIMPLDGDQDLLGQNPDENIAKKIKSIVFEVDYDAMYSGAIMHSKENIDRDDIVTVDNCSAALTVLESDGLFEREKMDRIGNKIFKMTARYDDDNGGADPSKVQKVGTYDKETDSIIYSREYQIYDNVILANYESTSEYVLKNYFTTVWAKYRTYSLMPYGESIRRAENVRKFLLLSKEKAYHENEGRGDEMLFGDAETARQFLSFVTPSKLDKESGTVRHDEKINCGYFVFYTGGDGNENTGIYLSDVNAFASGTSLCFNIATYDNISGGSYIDEMTADLKPAFNADDLLDYKTTQLWWNMVGSTDDAFVKNVGFSVCHLDNEAYFHDYLIPNPTVLRFYGEAYLKLPRAINTSDFLQSSSMSIGVSKKPLCKDNKEIIDMTMQFDYLAENRDEVVVSPWMSKLNDLIGHYDKFDRDGSLKTDYVGGVSITCFAYDSKPRFGIPASLHKAFIKIKASDFAALEPDDPFMLAEIGASFNVPKTPFSQYSWTSYKANGRGTLSLNKVSSVDAQNMSIGVSATFNGGYQLIINKIMEGDIVSSIFFSRTFAIEFRRTATSTEGGETYYYLEGDIPTEIVTVNLRDADENNMVSNVPAHYCVFQEGSDDPTELREANSSVAYASVSAESVEVRSFAKNMFVVASSAKADRRLEYTMYRYDAESDPAVNTFPEDFFVDAEASVENVFSVFEDESGAVGIYVNPSRYRNNQNIPFTVRSLQYYYRDDSGTMHFVFGVNLPDISRNDVVYDPFGIYLSAVSKRCMDVFDESHLVVGKAKNALLDPDQCFSDQYYEPVGRVPSTYQKAKYLESDGRQIIRIDGADVSNDTAIECEFMASGAADPVECMFGRWGADGLVMRRSEDGLILRVSARDSSLSTNPVAIDEGRRYLAKADSNGLSLNGIQVAWFHGVMYRMEPTHGIDAFGASLDGNMLGKGFVGRIYGMKVYQAGALAHDLVPCVRKSDGRPGLYDTANETFHANAGAGDLKYGF